MQPQQEEPKERQKSQVLWSLVVAVVVAVITSLSQYYFWTHQKESEIREKLFDKKYELLKEAATVCSKFQIAKIGQIRYELSLNSLREPVKGYKTNIAVRGRIDNKLRTYMPDDYTKDKEVSKILPEAQKVITLIQVLYGQKARIAAINYLNITNEHPVYYLKIYAEKKYKGKTPNKIKYELDDVANTSDEMMHQAFGNLLSAMWEELDSTLKM